MMWAGGLTEVLRICAMAAAYDLPVDSALQRTLQQSSRDLAAELPVFRISGHQPEG